MNHDKQPVAGEHSSLANPDLHTRLAQRIRGGLPGHLGIELVEVRQGYLCAQMQLHPHHLAANGYLHAGTVVTLADTACGFGCIANLPAGAHNFTTIELKSNFLRTVTEGVIRGEATLIHGGRRTQIWDATVLDAENRPLALFRCTQMILYPTSDSTSNPVSNLAGEKT